MPNEGDTITIRGRRVEFSALMCGRQLYAIDSVEPDATGRPVRFALEADEIAALTT